MPRAVPKGRNLGGADIIKRKRRAGFKEEGIQLNHGMICPTLVRQRSLCTWKRVSTSARKGRQHPNERAKNSENSKVLKN